MPCSERAAMLVAFFMESTGELEASGVATVGPMQFKYRVATADTLHA